MEYKNLLLTFLLVVLVSNMALASTIIFEDDGESYADGTALTSGEWDYIYRGSASGVCNAEYSNKQAKDGSISMRMNASGPNEVCYAVETLSPVGNEDITYFSWIYDNNETFSGWISIRNSSSSFSGVSGFARLGFYGQTSPKYIIQWKDSYYEIGGLRSVGWHNATIIVNETGNTFIWDGDYSNAFRIPNTNTTHYVNRVQNISITGYPFSESSDTYYDGLYVVNNTVNIMEVSLIEPADGTSITAELEEFNASIESGTSTTNFTNATLYLWYSGNNTVYYSDFQAMSGNTFNSSYWENVSLEYGTYKWNVLGCVINVTLDHTCQWAPSNFTVQRRQFDFDNFVFSTDVYETDNQLFETNITTITTLINVEAYLVYNGTKYLADTSCTNGDCNLAKRIDIPINTIQESENKSFYWEVEVFDGSTSINSNSSTNYQNVSRIHIEQCDGTYTTETLNFTAYNETTLDRINPYSFDGTFEYWLGTGTTRQNVSLSDTSIEEATFCISPSSETILTDASIQYTFANENITYKSRDYYFQNASLTNSMQDIKLYLLDATESTSFIIEVVDETQTAVRGALVYIKRYYPGDNQYRTVQIAKTDSNGKSVGFYQTETVDYKHTIILNGTVVLDTDNQKVIGEETPYTLTFRIGDSLANAWELFEDDPNIQTTLSFNDTSNIVTFSYVDVTGSTQYGRLLVQKQKGNESSSTICDSSSTQSSATITCNLTGYEGVFVAKGYITTSNTLTDLINFVISTAKDVFDQTGLMLGWFIILTATMIGIWNPTVMIWMHTIATVMVSIIGFISFPLTYIFSIIAVAIILTIMLKT